jgi:hypothetical protein
MPIGGVQKTYAANPPAVVVLTDPHGAARTVTSKFFAETSDIPAYRRYSGSLKPDPHMGKKKRMEIRNLVAGSAVALAMVGTSMAGFAVGGPIGPMGVASADGCGSGTGAGGGVWCAPPNTPEQVLKAAHQNARGDLSDVGCQWPSCGPRWWPVKSPRPVQ